MAKRLVKLKKSYFKRMRLDDPRYKLARDWYYLAESTLTGPNQRIKLGYSDIFHPTGELIEKRVENRHMKSIHNLQHLDQELKDFLELLYGD